VLVVGAGPAGLECARALGQRGFQVTLAEARVELGGRVTLEAALPGLATWARVRDYRIHVLQTMANVDIYRDSMLTAQDVLDCGCDYAVIATGASWSRKVLGTRGFPTDELQGGAVYTPDDILRGVEVDSPVVVYDFDHYYMGSCLAERLRRQGHEVAIVTPANAVSAWTFMNNELTNIRERMIELGIDIVLEHFVTEFRDGDVRLTSVYRGARTIPRECGSLVVVGTRAPNDELYRDLDSDPTRSADSGITVVRSIGDCRAPGAIVHAVHSGHECAREIDAGQPIPISWERARF
jgi:dimethylamine/trimethylamine dehydrogenase